MRQALRFGVVGAGVFGGYHAEKCFAHDRVLYVGTYDPHPMRASAIAVPKAGKAFNDYNDLLRHVDAIIIASPARTHFDMALTAIAANKHVLIEKPMSINSLQAKEIITVTDNKNIKVQVGHQERFVVRAIGLDKISETPLRIEAQRLTPYSQRGRRISVTFDLMIHDIDLVLWLMGRMPDHIRSETLRVAHNHADASLAFLGFGDTKVRLSASRVDEVGARMMRLVYASGEVLIDFNKKILKNSTDYDLDFNFKDNPLAKDSLNAGLDHFVESILYDKPVAISALDGAKAVKIAEIIDKNGA